LPAGPSPLGRAALLANGPYAATLCCAPLEKFDYLILRGLIGRVCGQPVRCTFAFHPRRTTSVLRGASREELTQLAAQRTARPELAHKSPDRVVYREYAQRAFAASCASGMKVFGLHLLTNATADVQTAPAGLSGNTAFAVSKIQQTGSTTYVLGRDYSLRLSNGPDAPVGELTLLFEVDARCGSEEQARLQLSRVAPYLDRVAASVRYHGNSLDFIRPASLGRAAVRSVVLFALCGVAVRLFGGLPAFTWTWALYALFAFCGVSVVLTIARELLQRRFLWPSFRIVVK
jgi:hypothetical protein